MLSPVFHPNIAPHAICVGDHWGAGESLESLIIRIGEMLAYQSYNAKSPLNGEAARWVEENKHRMPLDPVSLLPEEDRSATASATDGRPQPPPTGNHDQSVATASPVVSTATESNTHVLVKCPQCGSAFRVAVSILGRKVRCKTCDQIFACAACEPTA
jgi:predicted Zn finger-like uncharacterized protein